MPDWESDFIMQLLWKTPQVVFCTKTDADVRGYSVLSKFLLVASLRSDLQTSVGSNRSL